MTTASFRRLHLLIMALSSIYAISWHSVFFFCGGKHPPQVTRPSVNHWKINNKGWYWVYITMVETHINDDSQWNAQGEFQDTFFTLMENIMYRYTTLKYMSIDCLVFNSNFYSISATNVYRGL